jgi:hypothetical protein
MYRRVSSALPSAPDRQGTESEARTVNTNLYTTAHDTADASAHLFAAARAAVSTAYMTFVADVDALTPVTLHAPEAAQLRDAADACLFGDDDAVEQLACACELVARLCSYGRLEMAVATRLHDEVLAVDTASLRLSSAAFA